MSPVAGPTPATETQVGEGAGQQPMPPTPPSTLENGQATGGDMATQAATPQSGYQQPPMGPPSHMMYNSKMSTPSGAGNGPPPPGPHPPPPGQPMGPYAGQPNYGQYGPRPAYGPPPGGYPNMYGRPNNAPPGYPGYPGGQQYSGGWNNSAPPGPQQPPQQPGMMPSSGKGTPPQGAPMPQRHPSAPPPHPGPGQYPPRPQQHPQMMKGYPPQAPPPGNSYNGPQMYNGPGAPPMYNGPGMPPPPHNSASAMGMPPHQPSGYPGSYPNAHPVNNYGKQRLVSCRWSKLICSCLGHQSILTLMCIRSCFS